MTTNTNNITMNNGLSFNLSNSMKLVRWDAIKALQPEKVEILTKWFELTGLYPKYFSHPVVDITTGIVYPNTSLGIPDKEFRRAPVSERVKKSIMEDNAYSILVKGKWARRGKEENHSDIFGNSVIGHRFVSASDTSVSILMSLYELFIESGRTFTPIPETPKKVAKPRRANKEYTVLGNRIIRDIKDAEKLLAQYEKKLGKMYKGQHGIGPVKKDIKDLNKIIKEYQKILETEKIYAEGYITVTDALCEQVQEDSYSHIGTELIKDILVKAIEAEKKLNV